MLLAAARPPPGQFHTSLTFCFEHTVMDFHCTACHTRKHNFIPNSSSADTALDTKSSGWRLLCNELHFFFFTVHTVFCSYRTIRFNMDNKVLVSTYCYKVSINLSITEQVSIKLVFLWIGLWENV